MVVGAARHLRRAVAGRSGRRQEEDLIKFHHAIIAFRETAEEQHQFHQSDHERPGLATSPHTAIPSPFTS